MTLHRCGNDETNACLYNVTCYGDRAADSFFGGELIRAATIGNPAFAPSTSSSERSTPPTAERRVSAD